MNDFQKTQEYQAIAADAATPSLESHDLGSPIESLVLFGLLLFMVFGFKW